jgi:hypothetical protein
MKEFIYYIKSLIVLFLLSLIVGISVGIIFENNTYTIYTVLLVMTLGFMSIVFRLFHLKFLQTH